MSVTQIDKATIKDIKSEVSEALKEVEEKFGVSISFKGGKYTESYFRTKIEFAVVDNGQVKSKEVIAYEDVAKQYGVTNGAKVGDRVTHPYSGKGFIVEGLNTKARKYPVNVSNKDGNFKMSVRQFNEYEVADY